MLSIIEYNFSCFKVIDISIVPFMPLVYPKEPNYLTSLQDTFPLCWSNKLAEDAQIWADKLAENPEGVIKPSHNM